MGSALLFLMMMMQEESASVNILHLMILIKIILIF